MSQEDDSDLPTFDIGMTSTNSRSHAVNDNVDDANDSDDGIDVIPEDAASPVKVSNFPFSYNKLADLKDTRSRCSSAPCSPSPRPEAPQLKTLSKPSSPVPDNATVILEDPFPHESIVPVVTHVIDDHIVLAKKIYILDLTIEDVQHMNDKASLDWLKYAITGIQHLKRYAKHLQNNKISFNLAYYIAQEYPIHLQYFDPLDYKKLVETVSKNFINTKLEELGTRYDFLQTGKRTRMFDYLIPHKASSFKNTLQEVTVFKRRIDQAYLKRHPKLKKYAGNSCKRPLKRQREVSSEESFIKKKKLSLFGKDKAGRFPSPAPKNALPKELASILSEEPRKPQPKQMDPKPSTTLKPSTTPKPLTTLKPSATLKSSTAPTPSISTKPNNAFKPSTSQNKTKFTFNLSGKPKHTPASQPIEFDVISSKTSSSKSKLSKPISSKVPSFSKTKPVPDVVQLQKQKESDAPVVSKSSAMSKLTTGSKTKLIPDNVQKERPMEKTVRISTNESVAPVVSNASTVSKVSTGPRTKLVPDDVQKQKPFEKSIKISAAPGVSKSKRVPVVAQKQQPIDKISAEASAAPKILVTEKTRVPPMTSEIAVAVTNAVNEQNLAAYKSKSPQAMAQRKGLPAETSRPLQPSSEIEDQPVPMDVSDSDHESELLFVLGVRKDVTVRKVVPEQSRSISPEIIETSAPPKESPVVIIEKAKQSESPEVMYIPPSANVPKRKQKPVVPGIIYVKPEPGTNQQPIPVQKPGPSNTTQSKRCAKADCTAFAPGNETLCKIHCNKAQLLEIRNMMLQNQTAGPSRPPATTTTTAAVDTGHRPELTVSAINDDIALSVRAGSSRHTAVRADNLQDKSDAIIKDISSSIVIQLESPVFASIDDFSFQQSKTLASLDKKELDTIKACRQHIENSCTILDLLKTIKAKRKPASETHLYILMIALQHKIDHGLGDKLDYIASDMLIKFYQNTSLSIYKLLNLLFNLVYTSEFSAIPAVIHWIESVTKKRRHDITRMCTLVEVCFGQLRTDQLVPCRYYVRSSMQCLVLFEDVFDKRLRLLKREEINELALSLVEQDRLIGGFHKKFDLADLQKYGVTGEFFLIRRLVAQYISDHPQEIMTPQKVATIIEPKLLNAHALAVREAKKKPVGRPPNVTAPVRIQPHQQLVRNQTEQQPVAVRNQAQQQPIRTQAQQQPVIINQAQQQLVIRNQAQQQVQPVRSQAQQQPVRSQAQQQPVRSQAQQQPIMTQAQLSEQMMVSETQYVETFAGLINNNRFLTEEQRGMVLKYYKDMKVHVPVISTNQQMIRMQRYITQIHHYNIELEKQRQQNLQQLGTAVVPEQPDLQQLQKQNQIQKRMAMQHGQQQLQHLIQQQALPPYTASPQQPAQSLTIDPTRVQHFQQFVEQRFGVSITRPQNVTANSTPVTTTVHHRPQQNGPTTMYQQPQDVPTTFHQATPTTYSHQQPTPASQYPPHGTYQHANTGYTVTSPDQLIFVNQVNPTQAVRGSVSSTQQMPQQAPQQTPQQAQQIPQQAQHPANMTSVVPPETSLPAEEKRLYNITIPDIDVVQTEMLTEKEADELQNKLMADYNRAKQQQEEASLAADPDWDPVVEKKRKSPEKKKSTATSKRASTSPKTTDKTQCKSPKTTDKIQSIADSASPSISKSPSTIPIVIDIDSEDDNEAPVISTSTTVSDPLSSSPVTIPPNPSEEHPAPPQSPGPDNSVSSTTSTQSPGNNHTDTPSSNVLPDIGILSADLSVLSAQTYPELLQTMTDLWKIENQNSTASKVVEEEMRSSEEEIQKLKEKLKSEIDNKDQITERQNQLSVQARTIKKRRRELLILCTEKDKSRDLSIIETTSVTPTTESLRINPGRISETFKNVLSKQ